MLYVVIALLIFSALIFIHEFGHFIFAKLFKVKVEEFSIGMGPKLFSKKFSEEGTAYSIRLLPFGGYVSMLGENEASDDEDAFCKKPIYQRFIITCAGAVFNIILGFILMFALVTSMSNLGSTTIFRFQDENAISQKSGLQIGDTITKVDGVSVYTSSELVYEIMRSGTSPIDIVVKRDGKEVTLENVKFPTSVEDGYEFGEVDFYVAAVPKTFSNTVRHAFRQSISSIKMIWQSLIDLITGKYGVEQMSGPVGVTNAIGDAAKQGSPNLIYLCAFITMNLGVFNLLPFPALDGGRIVFLLIEAIRRKPVKPEYEGYVHFAGILLLLALMIFITYKDIAKLFVS